ncbi:phospho-sugar mutase [Nocardioides sp. REDSEA-S30_B4]|uniref:phospho-sugar mutase n=1 Tax=Nocardioides sp. REDSEA-S30_B4 TaxID=1811552 RepID=UPI000A9CCA1D|nr:phospho-sugar mutase [Nocardioides sp. REDSEA-S30_B4]
MTSPSESELTDLLARARAWAAADPDATTRDELERIVAEVEAGGDPTDLADRFDGTLEFGTAGLRGRLGAGPNRMNRVVVLRAAAGLAAHLGPGGAVAIGYDARHLSDTFAEDTAAVMRGAGLDVWLLPRPLPTPVLAYAVRELGCVAGVMVTASHNPPEDNGYKVYLGDGSQIVSPVDAEIAERIAEVGDLTSVARGSDWQVLGEDLLDRYLDRIAGLVADGPRDLAVVHTSLHGVGGSPVAQVLERAGFPAPYAVAEQAQPDPDFPTVAFPNPEEDGAMDLALALAEQRGADLVVANDPDADRCAVGVRDGEAFRMLTGDQTGVLLAELLLRRGVDGTYDPDHVKDKDGVSALVLLCELAASLKAEGRSLLDLLDDLAREHGLHATDQVSVRVSDLTLISGAMERLRSTPPTSLGGLDVLGVDDLAEGSDDLPPTDGLRFRLADGARVIVRPSGTEPKVKCYLEVVVPVEDASDNPDQTDAVEAARISAATRLDALGSDIRAAAGL